MVNLVERYNHQLMDQNQGQHQVRRNLQTQIALSRLCFVQAWRTNSHLIH